ncbi:MAG: XapX domain-containing protein [bacterium]
MKEIFLTTLVGPVVGGIFSAFKLPIPAPPVFAGLMGIVGLWIGYALVTRIMVG